MEDTQYHEPLLRCGFKEKQKQKPFLPCLVFVKEPSQAK